ncbi:hypothetical protein [Streptomyces shaanxiensis]
MLAGHLPFDEKTLLDNDDEPVRAEIPEQGGEKELAKALALPAEHQLAAHSTSPTSAPPSARTAGRSYDDLISHLLAEGCSDAEILGECLTFAAAGMVTTREFDLAGRLAPVHRRGAAGPLPGGGGTRRRWRSSRSCCGWSRWSARCAAGRRPALRLPTPDGPAEVRPW